MYFLLRISTPRLTSKGDGLFKADQELTMHPIRLPLLSLGLLPVVRQIQDALSAQACAAIIHGET